MGFRAEALLKSKTFSMIVGFLSDEYANTILASRPHERQVREESYYLHKALRDIVARLDTLVSQKDEIAKMIEAKERGEDE